jgi:hypothetical protein
MHRTQKLDYALPPGLVNLVGKDTLILMSPEEVDREAGMGEPRVMTYKRGVHMDCDMKGPFMGKVLGVAIQASLLWYAAKASRRVGGKLWVSRVGDNTAILVWSSQAPSDPISLKSVARNLRGGALQSFDADTDADETRYGRAVQRLAGRTSLRLRRRAAQELLVGEEVDEDLPPSPKTTKAKEPSSPAAAGMGSTYVEIDDEDEWELPPEAESE